MTALKYYILIKLSKRFITFWYYIEGNDGFSPLGEPVIPLAIYCNGTDILFSKIAREEARKGSPCYYDDIFTIMQQVGTFSFRGAQYPNNKMLLFAIEQKFEEFFSQKLYGEIGSVQENRHSMPVGFVFDPELDNDTQNFVVRLFRNAGYSQVTTLDDGQYILELGKQKSENKDNYVVLTISDTSLYGRLYKNDSSHAIVSSLIGEMEVNPKERRLSELIFSDIIKQVQVGYTYEEELPRLMEKVKELRSKRQFHTGRGVLSGSIKLSDGDSWDFEIEASEIAHTSTESCIVLKLNAFLSCHQCNSKNCTVIVAGLQTQIEELYELFCNSYSTVMVRSEDVTRSILDTIIINNYALPVNNSEKPTSFSQIPEEHIIEVSPPQNKPLSSASIRKVKVSIATIKAKVRNNDGKGAKCIANELLSELHGLGVHDWDDEINSIISDITLPPDMPEKPKQNEHQKEEKVIPKVDPKKIQREVRMALADIKGKIRIKEYVQAESLLSSLQSKLHKDGFYDFDGQLEEVKKEIVLTPPIKVTKDTKVTKPHADTPTPRVGPSTPPKLSLAEIHLLQGKYADAKRVFASEGNSEMAQVCTNLIKLKRGLTQYKMGFEAAKRNKNKGAISVAIREMEKYQALCRKYNVNDSEAEDIINKYKSI